MKRIRTKTKSPQNAPMLRSSVDCNRWLSDVIVCALCPSSEHTHWEASGEPGCVWRWQRWDPSSSCVVTSSDGEPEGQPETSWHVKRQLFYMNFMSAETGATSSTASGKYHHTVVHIKMPLVINVLILYPEALLGTGKSQLEINWACISMCFWLTASCCGPPYFQKWEIFKQHGVALRIVYSQLALHLSLLQKDTLQITTKHRLNSWCSNCGCRDTNAEPGVNKHKAGSQSLAPLLTGLVATMLFQG